MTTNLLRNKKEGASKEAMSLVIGEDHPDVFTCPACSRPLEAGTSRCPDCGTRLIMGVRLKRAGMFLALGIVVGILIGGATTGAAITLSLKDPAAATTPIASAAATTPIASALPAAVTPTAAPSLGAPPDSAAPVAAVSAL